RSLEKARNRVARNGICYPQGRTSTWNKRDYKNNRRDLLLPVLCPRAGRNDELRGGRSRESLHDLGAHTGTRKIAKASCSTARDRAGRCGCEHHADWWWIWPTPRSRLCS